MRPGRLAALLLAALGVAALAVIAAAAAVTEDGTWWQVVLVGAAVTPTIVLGLLLAGRRPELPVGALLVAVGSVPLTVFATEGWAETAATAHPWPGATQAAAIGVGSWIWFYVPPALLAALFPDGHLPSRRWRWLVWGWPLVIVVLQAMIALDPASYVSGGGSVPGEPPFDVSTGLLLALGWAALVAMLALLIGSAAAMAVRYRRSGLVVRQQIRWFALSALLVPLVLLLCWVSYWVAGGPGWVVVVGLLVIFVAMPLSASVAIMRHDLYDIDRLLSRTASYAVLSALLASLFVVTVLTVGLLVGRGSAPAAAAATLVCAVAFGLVRRRVQVMVDRRFDRDHHDAIAEVTRFVARMRDGSAEPEHVEEALQRALRDPRLRVAYDIPVDCGGQLLDANGRVVESAGQWREDVRFGGRRIGWIMYGEATARRAFLRREVLEAAHLPLEVARARIEVRAALAETRASRARLVRAGYDERRRLERDLHDGAQQRLVAIGMSLRLAQRHLPRDSATYDALENAVLELQSAVTELRRISQGVRPRGLDDGLPAALRSLVHNCPAPVDLHVMTEPVTDDVATTAYFVAAEAMTNALKHANPSRLAIDLTRDNGSLRIKVHDDGAGGAAIVPGSGLAGLVDRVEAGGGALRVDSETGCGTYVEAVLPLRP